MRRKNAGSLLITEGHSRKDGFVIFRRKTHLKQRNKNRTTAIACDRVGIDISDRHWLKSNAWKIRMIEIHGDTERKRDLVSST